LEKLQLKCDDVIKVNLQDIWLEVVSQNRDQVGLCEHGDETFRCIKGGKFVEYSLWEYNAGDISRYVVLFRRYLLLLSSG
jgi:hypothetical protein